jgi:hypothetical protein
LQAQGEIAGGLSLHMGQPEKGEDRLRLFAHHPFLLVHEGQGESFGHNTSPHVAVLRHQDIVEGAHSPEKLHILEGTGNAAAGDLIWWEVCDVLAPKVNSATRRVIKTSNTVKNGRFASTIGANQPMDLPLLESKSDVVNRA